MAIAKMQIQQNRMIQSADKAISQIAEISHALDDAMSGKIAFGAHHLTILCIEKSLNHWTMLYHCLNRSFLIVVFILFVKGLI